MVSGRRGQWQLKGAAAHLGVPGDAVQLVLLCGGCRIQICWAVLNDVVVCLCKKHMQFMEECK